MFGMLKKYHFRVENRLDDETLRQVPIEVTIKAETGALAEQTAAELGFKWHTLLTGPLDER